MDHLPKSLLAFFWHFIKKWWVWFAAVQFFAFGWALDHTAWPYVFMKLIDAISNMADRTQMWTILQPILVMWALLWITIEIGFRATGILLAYTLPKAEADIRLGMFDYVQYHSQRYFSDKMAGSIANKIADMPSTFSSIMRLLMTLFMPSALAVVIMTAFFLWMQPVFALIMTSWVIIHLGICFIFAKKCTEYSDIHAEARSTLAGKMVDAFSNHMNLRLFARQAEELRYIRSFQEIEKAKHFNSLWFIEKVKALLGLLSILLPGIANTWYMLYSWQQGFITTAEVVFIFNICWNVTMMVWISGLELPQFFREIGVCKQALSIIKDRHDVVDQPGALPIHISEGEIKFDRVSFSYDNEKEIFRDKTLIIRAGEKVGLVGFSGSGKTTFVNLILRNYNVDSGKIFIDNQDIAAVTQKSLREQISMIPQEPALFHRSLYENILYGNPKATKEEVYQASRKAHCQEFIETMPQGYETVVGERGAKLSGGQRQRIAIARAFLKNAPILILDEATSALDSVTERHIQEALTELMHRRTTIVIAHRLSTLSGMDRILVFKNGRIIEEGTHQDLVNAKGHYAHMWQMQSGGFMPENDLKDRQRT